jgi:hypothetical protein
MARSFGSWPRPAPRDAATNVAGPSRLPATASILAREDPLSGLIDRLGAPGAPEAVGNGRTMPMARQPVGQAAGA